MAPENRRSFVKKSMAASISVSSAAFFSSLIRARGDDGGGETTTANTTTEVWETTYAPTTEAPTTEPPTTEGTGTTTEPWDPQTTTEPPTEETTTEESTLPQMGMLCDDPTPVDATTGTLTATGTVSFAAGGSNPAMVGLLTLKISTTKYRDPSWTYPYLSDDFSVTVEASIAGGGATLVSDTDTLNVHVTCDEDTGGITVSADQPAMIYGGGLFPYIGKNFTVNGHSYNMKVTWMPDPYAADGVPLSNKVWVTVTDASSGSVGQVPAGLGEVLEIITEYNAYPVNAYPNFFPPRD